MDKIRPIIGPNISTDATGKLINIVVGPNGKPSQFDLAHYQHLHDYFQAHIDGGNAYVANITDMLAQVDEIIAALTPADPPGGDTTGGSGT